MAEAAEVTIKIECHSFRATGIIEYLRNGGRLKVAQQMANHESSLTTGFYDRRSDQILLDEVVPPSFMSAGRNRMKSSCEAMVGSRSSRSDGQ